MAYERKCKNWLSAYKDWVMPRINAPESYVFWSGMNCLSAAIRRKVFIGKDTLGTWECYPHCYIILVGPPGFRKNTAMGPAIELLEDVYDMGIITRAPILITKESLVDSIMKSKDSSIYLTVEEFGDLLLKSGPEMYELLTSLFDAKKKLDQGTMSRSYELAERPCVNLLAGTTPQWIADKMPESVIGGGLASRIIFVFEDTAPDSRIFFRKNGKKKIEGDFFRMRQDLLEDLIHIASNIEGEFQISDEVEEWMEDWNKKRKKGSNPKLAGFYARKITHVLKIAQLIHLSYSDTLLLELSDIQISIGIVEGTEATLPKVFAGVGKNIYSLDSKEIVRFINDNPGVPRDKLYRAFEAVATADKMQVLVDGLLIMRLAMSKISDKGEMCYYPLEVNDSEPKIEEIVK